MATSAQFRRMQGLCAVCSQKSETYRCPKCNAVKQANNRLRENKRVKAGLCKECGKPLDDTRYKRCSACRMRDMREYDSRQRALSPDKAIEFIIETLDNLKINERLRQRILEGFSERVYQREE